MARKLFSIYNRATTFVFLGILSLSILATYYLISYILISDFDENLNEKAVQINNYVAQNGHFPPPEPTDEWLLDTSTLLNKPVKTHFTSIKHFDPEDKDSVEFRSLLYSYPSNGRLHLVEVSRSMEALRDLAQSITIVIILSLLLTLLAVVLLNRFILKKIWNPFYTTLEKLKSFSLSKGQPVYFSETSIKEFNIMNKYLNEVIFNAEKEYLILKEFSENAAHEFQTPVSIIQSKLDLIIQGDNLNNEQIEAINAAYASVKRISNLYKTLLLLSRIENRRFNQPEAIKLKEKLEEKLKQFEQILTERNIQVEQEYKNPVIVIDSQLLDILLNNVLGNAIRHNIQDGKIKITASGHQLMISNTSADPAMMPQQMFRRFHKIQSRQGNTGLGLAIIKQICDQSDIQVRYWFRESWHTFSFTRTNNL